jgi:hypothetical protein
MTSMATRSAGATVSLCCGRYRATIWSSCNSCYSCYSHRASQRSPIGPANRVEANADDGGIVGRGRVVVREQTEFLGLALTVVANDGALPAVFLKVVEFAHVSDSPLPRSGVGQDTFDRLGHEDGRRRPVRPTR